MSMYEIAVADGHQHERGAILLAVLDNPVIARFRDAWVEKSDDGPVNVIYTRQGVGNRACSCGGEVKLTHVPENCHAACNEALQAHPLYLRDADDTYDSTYATFFFRAQEEYREVLDAAAVDPVDMHARWKAAIDRIERGEIRPAEAAMMDQFAAMLTDPSPDAPKIMEV